MFQFCSAKILSPIDLHLMEETVREGEKITLYKQHVLGAQAVTIPGQ